MALTDELHTAPDAGHWVYHLVARLPGVDPEYDVAHVYIGVTSNLQRRLKTHARKWWWQAIDGALCEFLEFPSRAIAEQAERELIELYEPAVNVQHRRRLA